MSTKDRDRLVSGIQTIINKVPKGELTLPEWQFAYRAVIVEIGIRIAQEFKDIAAQGHQGGGPRLDELSMELAEFALGIQVKNKPRR